jgi:DNA-3-methyladenine glycosylase I
LILEGAQAGLSWLTVLRKRDGYRRAFHNFEPAQVASFGPEKVQELIDDGLIIRNRAKIQAAIQNAQALSRVVEENGSFSAYVWTFVDGGPVQNTWHSLREIPAQTEKSKSMSKDLRKRGFSFVGPTICYAFMQAAGLVNDHITTCFRYSILSCG